MRTAHSSGHVEGYCYVNYSWQPPPQPKPVLPLQQQTAPTTQLFEVHATTKPGDSVVLVGSVDALGCWDVAKGFLMETDEDSYPIWNAWLRDTLPACEYKFVIVQSSGEVIWEQNSNRKLREHTNRVAAIFGESREISRTKSNDLALFARRQKKMELLDSATIAAPPPKHDPTPQQLYNQNKLPHAPIPAVASPLGAPPSMSLGSPLTPFVPYVPGNSVESSPCVSRNASRPLSRMSSHGSFNSMRQKIVHAQPEIRRSGSRVSFSQNLVDLPQSVS